jgi:hypothetical protein
MEPDVFPRRLLVAWIAAASLALALTFVLLLRGESPASVGASTFSRSAVGHAGIAEILRRRQDDVVIGKGDSLHRAGAGGLLVLAEPYRSLLADDGQQALLRAPRVLLVLPKWLCAARADESGWIGSATPVVASVPEAILALGVPGGRVVRPAGEVAWSRNDIGAVPHLTAPVQLVQSDALTPMVGNADGMLLGELDQDARRLWVLADPDVLSNHGLGDGNAAFAVGVLERLSAGGPVVFDETIHGFTAVPESPLALLERRPFAAIAVQAAIALGLLMWAAGPRFGAPETAPAPLKAGKRDLVRNVAQLFRAAGYRNVLVRRYVEETVRDVAFRLHAPGHLSEAARLGWLQRAGAARRVSIDCAMVSARATRLTAARRQAPAELFGLAREIWAWKQEMLHGTGGSAGGRGSDSRRGPQGGGRTG